MICRTYSVGSPSEYLRRVGSIGDIALDYATARHYRDKSARTVSEMMRDDLRGLPHDAEVGHANQVALQWLVLLMSSK